MFPLRDCRPAAGRPPAARGDAMTESSAEVTRSSEPETVLEVEGLSCALDTADGRVKLVDDVSFTLRRGETLGIVGESGSGKTMLVRSLMGIAPKSATVAGRIRLDGVDLLSLPKKQRRRTLGAGMGMVFQNPMTSL